MVSKYKSNRDGYLQRKFGITEEEVDAALAQQGGVCKACSQPPGARSLHIDHYHEIANWKITSQKLGVKRWEARPETLIGSRLDFRCYATTKPEARKLAKAKLKRLSVRGILCWHCNAGLKKYQDDPVRIHKIAEYLDEYYEFVNGEGATRNGFGE